MNNGFSDTLSSKQYAEQLLQQQQESFKKLTEYPYLSAWHIHDLTDRVEELETQMLLAAGLIRSIQSRIDNERDT